MKINGKSIIKQTYEKYVKQDVKQNMKDLNPQKKIIKDTVEINSANIQTVKDKIDSLPEVRMDKINSVKKEYDIDVILQSLMNGGFLV